MELCWLIPKIVSRISGLDDFLDDKYPVFAPFI